MVETDGEVRDDDGTDGGTMTEQTTMTERMTITERTTMTERTTWTTMTVTMTDDGEQQNGRR